MYAQLVRSRTTDQTCAEVHRIVADELIPALHNQPGLAPLLRVAGTSPGDHQSTSFWEVTVRV